MRNVIIILLFCLSGFGYSSAQVNAEDFGKLTLQINDEKPYEYEINRALLYRNVSLHYDTTAEIQSALATVVYYYPQLLSGPENILRLILTAKDKESRSFIDVFFNLGDSLYEEIEFRNRDSTVFVNVNGALTLDIPVSRHLNGTIQVKERKSGRRVSGKLAVEFDYPILDREVKSYYHLKMQGSFDVPSGKFREVSLSTVAPTKKVEKRYKRNLLLAFIAITVVLIFGLK